MRKWSNFKFATKYNTAQKVAQFGRKSSPSMLAMIAAFFCTRSLEPLLLVGRPSGILTFDFVL